MTRSARGRAQTQTFSTQTVFEGILQKTNLPQSRQRVLYISNSKGCVDGFVGELTSAKRLSKHFP